MKPLTKPRKGLDLQRGRWLMHLNWSRSWDGWADDIGGWRRHKVACVYLSRTADAFAIEVTIWRLMVLAGRASSRRSRA